MNRHVAEIVEALRAGGLLEAFQDEALAQVAPDGIEPRAFLDEVVHRGWLTAYQAEQVAEGRERDLVLDPYLLLKPLGRGGMGQVFLAKHRRMKRSVALKLIRADLLADPSSVRRFHREIEAVARLSHPNIVLAHDAGEVRGTHFLVMEYVEGIDLARHLEEHGRLDADLAVDLLRQACLGLQHAYEQGLVHRDVKPSNLMLDRRGALKILDLGLARINPWHSPESSPVAAPLTPSGVPIGTPDYLAPEQLIDPGRVDIRTDLYSLGCTFYHLIAGRPPFDAGNLFQKFLSHKEQEPAPLGSLRPDLPPALGSIVRTLMAKRPGDRFATPAEVVAALDSTWESAPAVRPPGRRGLAGPLPSASTIVPAPGQPPKDAPGPTVPPPARPIVSVLPIDIPDDLVPLEGDDTKTLLPKGLIPLQPLGAAGPEGAPPSPTSPRAATTLDRGWSLLRWGEARRAVEDFDEILEADPDEPRALLGRGQALAALGEAGAAIADLVRYIELRPRDPEGHYQCGLARLAEGSSRRRAIEDFAEAIRLDPSNPLAFLNRGLAYARRRDDPPALADYEQALKLDPNLAQAYFYRGLIHARHRRFEEAMADYDEAIRLDPGHAQARNNRGVANMHLGRFDLALDDYREALRIDPKYAVAHQNLGLALTERAEYDEAIAHFGEAMRLDPELPVAEPLARAYLRRGLEHARRGDYPQAISDYGKALRIDPSLASAYLSRGVALAKLGDADRAIEHFNEAIRADPNLAQAYYNRSLLLAKAGKAEEADADLRTAIRLDPKLGKRRAK